MNAESDPQPPKEDPLNSGRVLIVDDNPTNIDVLFDFLSDLGYDVLVAEDGMSALERVEYATPEIILLDIMMPRMDGIETCQKLKENPATADVPVIFMTALDGLDDKMKGFRAGGVDYITKPFQNEEVHARVRTHLALERMRNEMQERNEQLAVQNEALDAYARTVAHDLKNPLNLIINFTRLTLDDGLVDGPAKDDLNMVIRNGERMNHIIQDLLLLAQMRKDEVEPVLLDMNTVVNLSLERLETDLRESGGALVVPEAWPAAMGHAAWVQAVWVNYISNAIKYGGESPRIELLVAEDPENSDYIWFGVKDQGTGIPEKMKYKIFEEFSRVGGERAEGHGIGLSIVRRIVSRFGGRVGVDNNPEGEAGCTFYFTLPKAQ